jgi:hypothetical protein
MGLLDFPRRTGDDRRAEPQFAVSTVFGRGAPLRRAHGFCVDRASFEMTPLERRSLHSSHVLASLLASAAVIASQIGCGSSGRAGGPLGEVGTYEVDGGPSFTTAEASVAAPLDASIEQNHVAVTLVTVGCAGGCADVEAVATGGHPPYTFEWNDGATNPERQVCPTSNASYEVTVTDTGTTGEFPQPAETSVAKLTADVLACPDAGALVDAGPDAGSSTCVGTGAPLQTGCEMLTANIPPLRECPEGPNTPPIGVEVGCLPQPLVAGARYTASIISDNVIVAGDAEQWTLSGGQGDCTGTQMFVSTNVSVSGNVNASACITAASALPALVYNVQLEGSFHATTSAVAATLQICAGCASP